MSDVMTLPPLPFGDHQNGQLYTADQMRAYGEQCALAEMWQPIESAPKDGPCLIAWTDGDVWHIRRAYWDEKFEYNYDEETDTEGYTGAWTDNSVASWAYQERNSFEPTHWMPLPSPPKVTP